MAKSQLRLRPLGCQSWAFSGSSPHLDFPTSVFYCLAFFREKMHCTVIFRQQMQTLSLFRDTGPWRVDGTEGAREGSRANFSSIRHKRHSAQGP